MEAPITVSPTRFSTGMLSPVNIDSSTVLCPSVITPSTGIRSPGLTKMTSPTATCAISTNFSLPSFNTTAFFGAKANNSLIASEVLPLLMASKVLPSVINVKITAADS